MTRTLTVSGVIALALGGVWACSSSAPPSAPPPGPAPVAAPQPQPPQPRPAPRPSGDQCGLSELRGLVGKPKTEIPIPLDPGNRRVACTTCPITEEYMPRRQTILFDAETGRVTEVRCG